MASILFSLPTTDTLNVVISTSVNVFAPWPDCLATATPPPALRRLNADPLFFFAVIKNIGALQCGADLVVQSAHKTLGSLTQSAFLHLGKGEGCMNSASTYRYLPALFVPQLLPPCPLCATI